MGLAQVRKILGVVFTCPGVRPNSGPWGGTTSNTGSCLEHHQAPQAPRLEAAEVGVRDGGTELSA